MAKGKPWPPEQEKKLRELVEAKMPLRNIAVQLGLSENSVQKKCKRLGLEEEGAKGLRTSSSIVLPRSFSVLRKL